MDADEDGLAPTLGGGSAPAKPWPVETKRAAIRFRMPPSKAQREERERVEYERRELDRVCRELLFGGRERGPSEHLGLVTQAAPPPQSGRRWWEDWRL